MLPGTTDSIGEINMSEKTSEELKQELAEIDAQIEVARKETVKANKTEEQLKHDAYEKDARAANVTYQKRLAEELKRHNVADSNGLPRDIQKTLADLKEQRDAAREKADMAFIDAANSQAEKVPTKLGELKKLRASINKDLIAAIYKENGIDVKPKGEGTSAGKKGYPTWFCPKCGVIAKARMDAELICGKCNEKLQTQDERVVGGADDTSSSDVE